MIVGLAIKEKQLATDFGDLQQCNKVSI